MHSLQAWWFKTRKDLGQLQRPFNGRGHRGAEGRQHWCSLNTPFKAGLRDRWMTREEYPAAIWEHLCLIHVLSGWNSLGMTLRNPSLSQHLRNVAYPVSNSLLAGHTDQLKIIWRPPIFNFIILDLKSRIRQHHAYGDIKWIWHAVGYMISRLQTATKVMTL